MTKNPLCIRRANTVEEAKIITGWLAEQGVEATLVDPNNPGVLAFGVTDIEGITICVADSETAERAKALLTEHDTRHAETVASANEADLIDLGCEECGKMNSFPADLSGTVQECPECGTFVDVPEAGS